MVTYRRLLICASGAVAAVAIGCNEATVDSNAVGVRHLQPSLSVNPGTVNPGMPFSATVILTNPLQDTVRFETPTSCLALLWVLQGEDTVGMKGTSVSYGCRAAVTPYTVPPGEALVQVFDLAALLQWDVSPWLYVVSPSPGEYRLRASLDVEIPDLEQDFTVEPWTGGNSLQPFLRLEPTVAHPGDTIDVTLLIANPTREEVRFTTPHSCVGWINVFRGAEQVWMLGSQRGCATVLTDWSIPPGAVLPIAGEITAMLVEYEPASGLRLVPPPEGIYAVRTWWDIDLPVVADSFLVLE